MPRTFVASLSLSATAHRLVGVALRVTSGSSIGFAFWPPDGGIPVVDHSDLATYIGEFGHLAHGGIPCLHDALRYLCLSLRACFFQPPFVAR